MSWYEAALEWPLVHHASLAGQRFFSRFGVQFAAAITYFSVLSMVPILMVAFAALGLAATLLQPAFADGVHGWLVTTLGADTGGVLGDQILAIIDQAFHSWQAVGIVGLAGAAWAGAKWVMHLQIGVRMQLRPTFEPQPEVDAVDLRHETLGFARRLVRELGILFGLFGLVAVTFLASSLVTVLRRLTTGVLAWLGLPAPNAGTVLVSLLVTFGGAFALFWFLFTVMPERRPPLWVRVQGAAIGAAGLTAMDYAAGFLLGGFAEGPAVAVFGSVIVLMLFLNMFAGLVLIVAAWIATHPANDAYAADAPPRGPATTKPAPPST